MRQSLPLYILGALLLCCGCTLPEVTEPKLPFPEDAGFLFYSDGAGPGDLYAGVTEYTHPDSGVTVVAVPMVHVGDHAFYESVQAEVANCDVVLEESVSGVASIGPFLFMAPYLAGSMRRDASYYGLSHQSEVLDENQR